MDVIDKLMGGVSQGIGAVIVLLQLLAAIAAFVAALAAWKYVLAPPVKFMFGVREGQPNEIVDGLLGGVRVLAWAAILCAALWLCRSEAVKTLVSAYF